MDDDGMMGDVVVDDVQDGGTALYKAAWNGHIDIVKHLIENGANINAAKTVCFGMMFVDGWKLDGKMDVWLDWTVGVLDG